MKELIGKTINNIYVDRNFGEVIAFKLTSGDFVVYATGTNRIFLKNIENVKNIIGCEVLSCQLNYSEEQDEFGVKRELLIKTNVGDCRIEFGVAPRENYRSIFWDHIIDARVIESEGQIEVEYESSILINTILKEYEQ